MMHRFVRCLFVALLAVLPTLAPVPLLVAQAPTPVPLPFAERVKAMIAGMSVQQRVGQLFLVSFPGNNVAPDTDIADLITNYHIGGVLLRAANGNFNNAQTDPSPPQQVAQLANALQTLALTRPTASASLNIGASPIPETPEVAPATNATPEPTETPPPPLPAIPLFIALSSDVDARPRAELSEVTQNVTLLPSQMANGATWKPDNARISGEIFGREFAQMGVNVLFGPMLDVVDAPKPNTPGDLGVSVFGGDPFWVGRMGAAFVTGVHRGSENRIAIIAKNFPGLGSSDRDVREEMPTVQKSLEQLKQIELAPFFAVMRGNIYDESTVDGLMVSHIRYRGFQGNIRASTRPVSLDPQAYQALMTLPETAEWRNNGGITFSDSLGARSVRRFYDPMEASFNARRIAQEAFVAGNDVLLLDTFGLTKEWTEQLANIKDAIRFFQTRYVEDPNFATRVDESLQRILSLKLRLNKGNINMANLLVDDTAADQMPLQTSIITNIAKQSITLLAPSQRDLPAVLPNAPTKDDTITFITDDRQLRDCPSCEPYPAVPKTAMEELALNLYGPRTTGQVDPARVSSFTFSDLIDYNVQASATITSTPDAGGLNTPGTPSTTPEITATQSAGPLRIQSAIERSTWIVIAMIDTNPAITPTQALRTFLSQSADTLKDKRVIVFALGAPYHLDATEVSKVTAYFGVYSRQPAFLEAALRALFGEYVPTGKSPVSVPALNYSLINVTAPDPTQVIPLTTGDTLTDTQSTPEPLLLKTGDRLKLRAGPIIDLNGNLVPDGTVVQFILSYPAERVEQRQQPVNTRDGIAETTIALEREGKLEIRAEADPALTSFVVRVDTGNTTQIETIKPTLAPTETPAPAPTVAVVRPTTVAPIASLPANGANASPARASITGFLLTAIGLLLISFSVFIFTAQEHQAGLSMSARLRIAVCVWMLGWLIYAMVALGLPGMRWVTNLLGWAGSAISAILLTAVAAALLIAGIRIWRRSHENSAT